MSEDTLKRQCVKIAKEFLQENQNDFWFYCPTDRFYSGIPDIVCCYKSRWGAAELKTPRGKVTPLQADTLSKLTRAGAVAEVVRSTVEFKNFLQKLKLKGGE